jgi:WD40 repeat protein
MFRFTALLLVFTLIFPACSNLAEADRATVIFPHAHEFGTTVVAFSPDSRVLASGGHQGDIRLWDLPRKTALADLSAHKGVVRAIQFLSDSTFASGAEDGKLMLWDRTTLRTTRELSPVSSLALMGGRLVSGHDDGWIRIWNRNLDQLADLKLEQKILALSSRGDRLAVGTENRILIMDGNLNILTTLHVEGGVPHDLQFSPDGKTLAAGNWFRLSTWDLATGRQETHATEHNGLLTSVAYSPDGRQIATLGRHTDSAIRIVDAHSFQVARRYQAHELCGAMIRFSPDGRWIVSASDDESVRLYDLDGARVARSPASAN